MLFLLEKAAPQGGKKNETGTVLEFNTKRLRKGKSSNEAEQARDEHWVVGKSARAARRIPKKTKCTTEMWQGF